MGTMGIHRSFGKKSSSTKTSNVNFVEDIQFPKILQLFPFLRAVKKLPYLLTFRVWQQFFFSRNFKSLLGCLNV